MYIIILAQIMVFILAAVPLQAEGYKYTAYQSYLLTIITTGALLTIAINGSNSSNPYVNTGVTIFIYSFISYIIIVFQGYIRLIIKESKMEF